MYEVLERLISVLEEAQEQNYHVRALAETLVPFATDMKLWHRIQRLIANEPTTPKKALTPEEAAKECDKLRR